MTLSVICYSSDWNLKFHLHFNLRLITEVEQSTGSVFPLSTMALDRIWIECSGLSSHPFQRPTAITGM